MKTRIFLVLSALLVVSVTYAQIDEEAEPWRLEGSWPAYIHDKPLAIGAKDSDSSRLLKKRFNVTLDELRHRYTYWEMGEGQLQDVFDNVNRLESAREALPEGVGRPLDLQEQRLNFAKYIERRADPVKRPTGRNLNFAEAKSAEAFRLSIELQQLDN